MSYTPDDLKKARKYLFKQFMNSENISLDIQCGAKIHGDRLTYRLFGTTDFHHVIDTNMVRGLVNQKDENGKLVRDLEKYFNALREEVIGGLFVPLDTHDFLELLDSTVEQRTIVFHRAFGCGE